MSSPAAPQSNVNPGFSQRIFSGIQPSGGMTLGNYLGALKRFAEKQNEGIETIYCVVDLHAITVWQDPAKLRHQTREIAAAYLASGIDPDRSVLFNQSQVTGHAELAWILNCVARIGWMYRMTQFKDKTAGKNAENSSLGLLAYPSLMAADILLYHATQVPVGEDQKQHLELTRDIAAKFNHDYGVDFFPITEPLIEGAATRVMSLRDGTKKMSKSDPSDASRINLTDDADTIAKKIRKATSDAHPLPETVEGLKDRPEARNLVNIYAALAGVPTEAVIAEFAGAQFGTFKPKLADLAVAKLSPITAEMNRYMADPSEIDRILGKGADRADAIAAPILKKTKEIVGMIGSRG
ncbi:tryptophan--tRNA ligase [Pseudogemmobacter faecipullorum]|uniref:Tryptophan--tRNA ligase n=1 Tax=Pseudogemmobacter faecipullorum TaxID=2755041 RepID=A0ABS8CI04_9RHOB|nr:tryptophan--tRNA ligase [Pseudogemmobacter faecipullorum]MCB5409019.1 tryptophan--tRNA ligase [Pseudogemmobacter faecipullorum]